MSSPEAARQSLRRLQELEQLSSAEQAQNAQWSIGFDLKSDNLFLLTMCTTLICLSCLMVLFAQDGKTQQRIAAEQAKLAARQLAPLQTREIPLGEFESIARAAEGSGNVTVLQYEAFITTEARQEQLLETELIVMKHKHKLRAAVESVMHKASTETLKEPSLKTIRRNLVQELDLAVGGRKRVHDVQFAKFVHYQIPDTN